MDIYHNYCDSYVVKRNWKVEFYFEKYHAQFILQVSHVASVCPFPIFLLGFCNWLLNSWCFDIQISLVTRLNKNLDVTALQKTKIWMKAHEHERNEKCLQK
jgi:hypothetical protein